jgi:NifU-like protein involved in Fe-S cluster formation
MTALEDIYSQRILELAANSPRSGRLVAPDATATAHSKLCGSTVTLDIKMDGDRITDYGQQVRACLLGQSSAAVVASHAVGSTAAELREVGRQMRAMLKENGAPPGGKWADLAALEPVRDVKGRHASTLLVFDALEKAIGEVEAKHNAPAQAG